MAVDTPSDAPTRLRRPRLPFFLVLVPAATIGIGACLPVLVAAGVLRRRSLLWAGLGYVVVAIAGFAAAGNHSHPPRSTIAGFIFIGNAVLATGHTVALRRGEPATDRDSLSAARRQRKRRKKARAVIARDPRLAVEARIGRPDLPEHYNDGGLVDVNRVGRDVLATLPGIDGPLAERIIATRTEVGGFSSVSDLILTLSLPPKQLDDAEDRLVFIPL